MEDLTEYSIVTLNADGTTKGVINLAVRGYDKACRAAQDWERSYFAERDIRVGVVKYRGPYSRY